MTADGSCWVFTALTCHHCSRVIYGRNTLRNSVARPTLIREAKKLGAVASGSDWFCSRGCKVRHEMSPGIPKKHSILPTKA